MRSLSVTSSPSLGTTMAVTTSSPSLRPSGTPTMATSSIPGWSASRYSISSGAMFMPPRMMRFLRRPTNR